MFGRALLVCVGAAWCLGLGTAHATSGRGGGLYVGAAPLPVVSSDVTVDVRLGVARGTVIQRFHNPRPDPVEAVYVFPLPTGAAVDSLTASFGGQTVRGVIARRAEAAAAYQDAVAAGRAAALAEQERPGVFTQSLAPVPPGGEVTVTLTWQATLTRRGGSWELAHPLVVGPRFVPGAATGRPTAGLGTAVDTDRAPDGSRITPPTGAGAATPYRLEVRFDDALDVTSPTHRLTTAPGAGATTVSVADPAGDRELVLRWRSRADEQVRAVVEPAGAGAYVAVLIEPAAQAPAPTRARRRWVIALDRSPSLAGAGAAMVRAVGRALVARIPAGDELAIIRLGDRPAAFTADRAAASAAVDGLPEGSADLTRALATSLAPVARDRAVEVVIVTDGLVADDAAAIERAAATGLPVHTIGVGAAPNRWLLEAIAGRTGAVARVAASIDDLDGAVDAVAAADRRAPYAVELRSPATLEPEVSADRVGPGQAALWVALVPAGVPSRELEVAIGARTVRARLERRTDAGLAATWARLRVARLYRQGDRAGATQLALDRGLVAPTTALLATSTRADEPVRSVISVPVPLPAGTRADELRRERDLAVDLRPTAPPPPADPNAVTSGSGGAAGQAVAESAPDAGDDYYQDHDRVATVALGGAAPGRADDGEAQAQSPVGRRRALVLGLALGARLDERVPAAVATLGLTWPLPRVFAVGARVTATAAPLDDDPLSAAATVGLVTVPTRLPLSLSLGVGLGWSGGLGVAYDLDLVLGRGGLGLSLRWHGLAGPASASVLGLGVEAAF